MTNSPDAGTDTGTTTIGYKNPPRHSQFKKGQSGNPKGRPRGSKNKPKPGYASDLYTSILEAVGREVEVADGEAIIKLSMRDVITRTLIGKAGKGDPRALRLATELIASAERSAFEKQKAGFAAMIETKRDQERAFERWQRAGAEGPPLLPLPDDIILDIRGGTGHFAGPVSPEEAEMLAYLQVRFLSSTKSITEAHQRAARARTPEQRARWTAQAERETRARAALDAEAAPIAEAWPNHWPPTEDSLMIKHFLTPDSGLPRSAMRAAGG